MQGRDDFIHSSPPHQLSSLLQGDSKCRLPMRVALVVSNSQAEAANSPAHITESPVGLPIQTPSCLIIIKINFCSISHFVIQLFWFLQQPHSIAYLPRPKNGRDMDRVV